MSKQYKYVFCDLDDTFWDVKTNQRKAILSLYETHGFSKNFSSFDHFFDTFVAINSDLWLKYRDGLVKREELRNRRFIDLLAAGGIYDEHFAMDISNEYLLISPRCSALFDHSIEVLEYLKYKKGYPILLITNGFNEVQFDKVKNANLDKYFVRIITSEFAGVNKPDPGIFEYALRKAGVKASEVIMIGDDPYNDMFGAQNAGMDTIFFNTEGKDIHIVPNYEIKSLKEIMDIL